MKLILIIILFLAFTEVFLSIIFLKLKKVKWFIKSNEEASFDEKKFNKFKLKNYDFYLGWNKKKRIKRFDKIGKRKILYSISKQGYRHSTHQKKLNLITTFGDSYTFCRQVNNNETWQEQFSKKNKIFVSNFGVGNYGLDQAFLKYRKTKIAKENKIVIFGFVPETICRIQSSWKNFIEFGNVHGFKPYCILKNDKLKIIKNPLNPGTIFKSIPEIIKKAKSADRFYKDKYVKHIIKTPYFFWMFKNLNFNLNMIYTYLISKNKNKIEVLNNELFPNVMRNNIGLSHNLYKEKYSQNIMEKLLKKINNETNDKNLKCYFLIIPQLFDLKMKSRNNYEKFFYKLKKNLNIIDTTENFLKINDYSKLFINDKYGGHLNKKGNILISKILNKKIKL